MALLSGAGISSAAQYKIKSGDTLGEIARSHNVLLTDVIEDNPQIQNANLIYPNQIVYIDESAPKKSSNPAPQAYFATSGVKDGRISLGESEIALLARLIHSEANGESFEGKVAVGNVVLARMLDERFPNTLHDVIFAKNQFSVVSNGSINAAASNEAIKAAYEAVNRTNQGNNDMSLYFYNPSIVSQSWLESRPHTKTVGNHAFKK